MKKRWLFAILIFCVMFAFAGVGFFGQICEGATDGQLKVVATECQVYQTASFASPLLDQQGQPIILKHGDLVTKAEGGEESEKFEYIIFGEEQGYVFKFYLTSNLIDQVVYPIFNAKIVVQQAQVFDLQKQPTSITLEKGKELYLYEGYKSSSDGMTAVCFVDEEGGLYYGYVQTKNLEPYGINGWVITGIVVAASCVTIILLLVFMKKKKSSKKQK